MADDFLAALRPKQRGHWLGFAMHCADDAKKTSRCVTSQKQMIPDFKNADNYTPVSPVFCKC